MTTQPHALLVGDFVKHTGFARVNAAIADGLVARGWRVSILALHYAGDPSPLQQRYNLYPAWANGSDLYGMRRLPYILDHAKPDAVLIHNDPWLVDDYLDVLANTARLRHRPPVAAYMPVDGPGLNPANMQNLGRLDRVIAYTEFAATELQRAGLNRPILAIPLGIDLDLFQPGDRNQARALLGVDPEFCVVLLCDTNSYRKRHDLAIRAFGHFAASVPEARLLIHSEILSQHGWDLAWEVERAGLSDRVIWTGQGDRLTDATLAAVYQASDMRLTATGGEGWGYTTMESMACGVPVVAPRWSALAEWAAEGAMLVDCEPDVTGTAPTEGGQKHGVAMPYDLAESLLQLYRSVDLYQHYVEAGLATVRRPAYRWPAIADQFDAVLREMLPHGDASGRYAVERREAAHAGD